MRAFASTKDQAHKKLAALNLVDWKFTDNFIVIAALNRLRQTFLWVYERLFSNAKPSCCVCQSPRFKNFARTQRAFRYGIISVSKISLVWLFPSFHTYHHIFVYIDNYQHNLLPKTIARFELQTKCSYLQARDIKRIVIHRQKQISAIHPPYSRQRVPLEAGYSFQSPTDEIQL